MSAALRQLAQVDPRQPWYAPYAGLLGALRPVQGVETVASALAAVAQERGEPGLPAFVPASGAPPGEAYEAFVARTASVPTRDNLHDLCNGLVWLRFPGSKQRLNALQAAEIARAGVGPVRGAVRDAITLFDENGALLVAAPELWEALLAREWRRLFIELRPLWREARLVLFGHALLEQLAAPRKELTAHVWRAPAPAEEPLDSWLAGQLTAGRLAAKPFTPLPVLGVPGWWPGNQDFSFYDDARVFRSPESRSGKTRRSAGTSRP